VSGLRSAEVTWDPHDLAEVHAAIETETDRLDHLVGNLLDASRLQSGTLAVSLRPTAIEDVMSTAIAGVPATRILLDVGPDLPLVDTDPVLLERALANLVGNAVRYSPEDTTVRVEAKHIGDHVHIRITDHGPGIPRSEHELVFRPFQRLDDSSGHGIGLGLAITRGFVHAVGGAIELDETPGGGLTVLVTVPIATGEQPGLHPQDAP
jgi:two-component system sensor histidine kinase KdpD